MEPQDGTESSEKMALWRRVFPTYPASLTGAILMTLHSTVSNPYEEDLSEALLLDPQSQPRALRRRRAGNQDDARVIKWMWENVKRGFRGGVRRFEG